MFEVHELTAAGAFLAGPLLLEPGEKMKLAFKFDDGTRIEVDATVDSAERNGTSGVRVVFKNGEKIAARLG